MIGSAPRAVVVTGACGHSVITLALGGENDERVRSQTTVVICDACWDDVFNRAQVERRIRADRALFRAERRANRDRLAARGARI